MKVGGVAQMVERSLSMREVPGSIPGASTNIFSYFYRLSQKIKDDNTIDCIPINFASLIKKDTKSICQGLNRSLEARFVKAFYDPEVYECQKACTTFEYHGEHEFLSDPGLSQSKIAFDYWMVGNEVQGKRQYLIYDFNGLIGFVGGTLGLFVGFSIYSLVEKCVDILKPIAMKYGSQKLA